MKIITILFIFIFVCSELHAQKWDNNWFFGGKAGLNFNTNPPTPLSGEINQLEGCATISDWEGNLLFYTDGLTVWDRNHDIMPNGFDLMGGWSSSQSAIIVPAPGSKTLYYLFTVADFDIPAKLSYSIVDMTLHNGNGDIPANKKNILLLSNTTEKLTAALHPNRRDVWILTHTLGDNNFYAFKLTPSGIVDSPVISSIGVNYGIDPSNWYTGQLRISHDGKYVASSITFEKINELFDFNPSTGEFSNRILLNLDFPIYGMEFSPNDSLLYLSSANYDADTNYVFQYGIDDLIPSFQPVAFLEDSTGDRIYGSLQLGPDQQIYICTNNLHTLDIIHQPNNRGQACAYEARGIPLYTGTISKYGLPQNIVGPLIDEKCIIRYSLDACVSVMAEGSHMDFSEFTPVYPEILPCANVFAQHLARAPGEKHSCTPGFDGQAGMCIDNLESCVYDPGNNKSIFVEFTIDPPADSAVQISLLTFYERSPNIYEWINGPSGPNEMARYFGTRVLKNGKEIYRAASRFTHIGWTQEIFNFLNDPNFICDSTSHFRIEWLPYCPFGGDEDVSVWDIDQIEIKGGCVPALEKLPFISGAIHDLDGNAMPNVLVELSIDANFISVKSTLTDQDGQYSFENLNKNQAYFIRSYKNNEVLVGVSAFDLLKIQKHLLGIDPFKTLTKLIASDINHNNVINAFDLVTLQKTLLGLQPNFPGNTSWRFGIVPQNFNTSIIPNFIESWSIESLDKSIDDLDFIGIKIGHPE